MGNTSLFLIQEACRSSKPGLVCLFTVIATFCGGSSWVGCLWEGYLPNCHRIATEAIQGHCLILPVGFTGDMDCLNLTENQRLRTLRFFYFPDPKGQAALTLRTVRGIPRPSPSLALRKQWKGGLSLPTSRHPRSALAREIGSILSAFVGFLWL